MLSLHQIKKTYRTGDSVVQALAGVDLYFRKNEFVSVLGPSGCGKTTLLNVIGGLDRYDEGDLCIKGRSTREFRDADWDTYRNHSIGFVFQSYNLIAHQSVLANVELALTLSGVGREERRRRAVEALFAVGLGDQLNKRPSQMSGGQMQRVAIARALVNNPDILLADEPTGALDSATSIQIMDILREVAKTRLVVMVTHNPELAEKYSTRIIRLRDGAVISDSDPFSPEEEAREPAGNEAETAEIASAEKALAEDEPAARKKKKEKKKRRPSMSLFTALSLSFKNLLTKKTRTILVSFAGSIGIIGIALILALSNGVNLFIRNVQEETLTSYPVAIAAETSDYAALLSAMVSAGDSSAHEVAPRTVYVDDSISNMLSAMTSTEKNRLAPFKDYLEERMDTLRPDIASLQYLYDIKPYIYNTSTQYGKNGVVQVSPSSILTDFSKEYSGFNLFTDNISIFTELSPGLDGETVSDTMRRQYELVDGKWPEAADELVLIVDQNHTVTNITLYLLGLCNPDEMTALMASMITGEKVETNVSDLTFSFDDFYNLELHLAYNSDYFVPRDATYEENGREYVCYKDLRESDDFLPETVYDQGMRLRIVGIIAPSGDTAVSTGNMQGALGYTSALSAAIRARVNASAPVRQQLETPLHDIFTGLPFSLDSEKLSDAEKEEKLAQYFASLDDAGKAAAYLAIRAAISDEEMNAYLTAIESAFATYETKRQFLIDLYGFNSKNGSLATGSSANEAVSTILAIVKPIDGMDFDTAKGYYAYLVAYQYAAAFGLDGVALTPGVPAYEKYAGLIDALYNTEEKMSAAFRNMTEMTVRSVFPMVETFNVQLDLMKDGAPHLENYRQNVNAENDTVAKKREYIFSDLMTKNGVYDPTDALAASLRDYTDSLSGEEVETKFATLIEMTYGQRIVSDEEYRNAATAAMFDAYLAGLSTQEYAALYQDHMEKAGTTFEETLKTLGASDGRDALSAIYIYPVDFAAKERLTAVITDYNNTVTNEEDKISYTDLVALMVSSVTTIVNAISYVLVAFVSVSLVVSSIMIGIITYISVLERTKEIGILRAIGASKRDISRVFNAETLIIGFTAGAFGILATLLLCIPINLLIHHLSNIRGINATLPVVAAFVLIAISMALTLIAGIIPSRIASKKDPVEALRTE